MDKNLTRRNLGLAAAVVAAGGIATAAGAQPEGMGEMGGDWFSMIRRHHREIAQRLMAFQSAQSPEDRMAAFQAFTAINAAHSIAEEISVYPALIMHDANDQAWHLYHEQDEAKVLSARIHHALVTNRGDEAQQLAGQLLKALQAHVAAEENGDFPRLQSMLDPAGNAELTRVYAMEFRRAVS